MPSTFRPEMRSTTSYNSMFDRSHMQGYNGIKSKYLKKPINTPDEKNQSYSTGFYRSQNMDVIRNSNTQVSPVVTDRFLSSLGFNSNKAMKLQDRSKELEKTRNCSNYLKKEINIQSMLNTYRNSMRTKYPEPKKAGQEEEYPQTPAANKGAKGPDAAGKDKDKKGAAKKDLTFSPPKEEQKEEVLSERSVGSISNDSLIMDEHEHDFTTNINNMKGAQYPKKVQDYIKDNLIKPPNQGVNLTNLSSTKTGFTCSDNYKDFEYKKENLLDLME